MADRRLLLLQNAEAALRVDVVDENGEETARPDPLRIGRHLMGSDKSLLPDMSVEWLGEVDASVLEGETDESSRSLQVGVRCRVALSEDQTVDEALIPLFAWAELALCKVDFTLGGVATWGHLERIQGLEPHELADTFAGSRMVFVFDVPTKLFDPRQAP